jgi:anaerobic selenocysteine-containing dehydrogenase
LEVTDTAHRGHVVIPHGFGMVYDGKVHGVNVNLLTKNTNRDWLGTPMHRYVPCRVEATSLTPDVFAVANQKAIS